MKDNGGAFFLNNDNRIVQADITKNYLTEKRIETPQNIEKALLWSDMLIGFNSHHYFSINTDLCLKSGTADLNWENEWLSGFHSPFILKPYLFWLNEDNSVMHYLHIDTHKSYQIELEQTNQFKHSTEIKIKTIEKLNEKERKAYILLYSSDDNIMLIEFINNKYSKIQIRKIPFKNDLQDVIIDKNKHLILYSISGEIITTSLEKFRTNDECVKPEHIFNKYSEFEKPYKIASMAYHQDKYFLLCLTNAGYYYMLIVPDKTIIDLKTNIIFPVFQDNTHIYFYDDSRRIHRINLINNDYRVFLLNTQDLNKQIELQIHDLLLTANSGAYGLFRNWGDKTSMLSLCKLAFSDDKSSLGIQRNITVINHDKFKIIPDQLPLLYANNKFIGYHKNDIYIFTLKGDKL